MNRFVPNFSTPEGNAIAPEEFLNSYDDWVATVNQIQRNRQHDQFVFRGQGVSDWNLVPSLFRNLKDIDELNESVIFDCFKRELSDVSYFLRTADKMGFSFSGNSIPILNHGLDHKVNIQDWIKLEGHEFTEFITIAQHSGFPTRFLDYTFNPSVALFFAAYSAFQRVESEDFSEKELSKKLFSVFGFDLIFRSFPQSQYSLARTSLASNRYLNAQKGCFIQINPEVISSALNYTDLMFETILVNTAKKILDSGAVGVKNQFPVLYKFSFPYGLSPHILRRLSERGIDYAAIYPDMRNCITSRQFNVRVNNQWSKLPEQFRI